MRFLLPFQHFRRASVGGRIALTLFFSIFLAAGLFFLWLISLAVVQMGKTYTWKTAPALILESKVIVGKGYDPYSVGIRYSYPWEGRTLTGDQFVPMRQSYGDYAKAAAEVEKFQNGSTTQCYVDPHDPTKSTLRRNSPFFALFILLPLVFVFIGGGGIYSLWFTPPPPLLNVGPSPSEVQGKDRRSRIIMGAVFTAVGGGMFAFWALPQLIDGKASMHWTETPCTVISSRVRTHTGDKSTTYSPDILYRYTVGGTEHKSNRYDVMGGSSSGYAAKSKIVSAYPKGRQTVCYVNPHNPQQAVLKPGLGWSGLATLIPVLFFAVGLTLLIHTLRKPHITSRGLSDAPRTL